MSPDKNENGVLTKHKEVGEVSLKERIFSYLRYLPLFIASIAISLLLSYVYLRYATPLYNVSASLLIKNDKNSGGANERFAELMLFDNNNNLDNEIEILQSRTLMQRVAASLNLQTAYYAIGKIKTSNIYKDNPFKLEIIKLNDSAQAFSYKIVIANSNQFRLNESKAFFSFGQIFQTTHGTFRLVKVEPAFQNKSSNEFTVVHMTLDGAAAMAKSGLKIRPVNNRSSVLSISLTTENTKLGEDIINQLMVEYNKATIEDKNQIAQSTYNFIDNRLRLLASELGDVEKDLQEFKKQNQIYDLAGQTGLFFSKMTELEKSLSESEVKLEVAKLLEEYLLDKKNLYEKVPGTLGIDDPTLLAAATAFNELVVEREKKLKETAPDNFLVKELELKIDRARSTFIENLRNIKRSYDLVIKDLSTQSNTLRTQVQSVPQKEKGLREIARQQGIKENLYLYLLQKREETAITLASTISNSRVVDGAVSSSTPVSPNRKSVYTIAFVLAILIPILIIYLLDILNDKVQSNEDIQKVVDVPIIGNVGHSSKKEMLVVTQNNRKVIAEQFRIIRTNLQYFSKSSEKPVILVTSSFSGEGKSFISANLGSVMALAGKKTVILEFDIRKPKVASGLQLNKKAGITNFMIGSASIDDITVPVATIPNLYVIPCGPIPPNPAELLLDEKLKELFRLVKERFDVVLIDSAPVGLVSDAIELGKFANCTVYIIRQRYTLKKQLRLIDEIYTDKRLPGMSVLLNDVTAIGGGYYGYKGYGGYGYGYGYGAGYGYYDEEDTKGAGVGKKIKRFFGSKK